MERFIVSYEYTDGSKRIDRLSREDAQTIWTHFMSDIEKQLLWKLRKLKKATLTLYSPTNKDKIVIIDEYDLDEIRQRPRP